jgi:trans-aconitate methyltransferase
VTRTWHQLLEDLLESTGADHPIKVLELGCAPGSMLVKLHGLRPANSYFGMDSAPRGLAAARQLLAATGVDAQLHLGDLREVRLSPVDLVVSFGLIEHFEDPTEIMSHHRQFLSPGGVAAVTVPNYSHPVVVALMKRFAPETLATHNLRIMSQRSLHRAFTDAGFSDVRVGESGGSLLPNSRVRRDFPGISYSLAARSWNLSTNFLPDRWPWPAVIWGTGVHPG